MERLRRKLGDGVPLGLVFPPSPSQTKPKTMSPASSQTQASIRRMLQAHLCDLEDEEDSDIENHWPPTSGFPPASATQHQSNHERFVVHHRQSTPTQLPISPPSPAQARRGGGSASQDRTLCANVESPDEWAGECG
jgi:hypothetical protein